MTIMNKGWKRARRKMEYQPTPSPARVLTGESWVWVRDVVLSVKTSLIQTNSSLRSPTYLKKILTISFFVMVAEKMGLFGGKIDCECATVVSRTYLLFTLPRFWFFTFTHNLADNSNAVSIFKAITPLRSCLYANRSKDRERLCK